MDNKKIYRYFSAEEQESQWIDMPKGRNTAGYGVGILIQDIVWYPIMPGNVVNAWTYDFPVKFKPVKGLDTPTLHSGDDAIYEKILEAANELVREDGVRAISSACGFFGHFHRRLAEDMDIPVGLSSLVQVPWVRAINKSGSKIGILTADASSMTDSLLKNCGIEGSDDLVIADLRYGENFSAIMEDRGSFDNAGTRREVVSAAVDLVKKHPDISSFVLECSDMPPYAYAIQAATNRPVYDFITLIKWLNNAAMQKPYSGWI